MKNRNIFQVATLCVVTFLFAMSCNSPAEDTTTNTVVDSTAQKPAAPDMDAVKAEIQTLESAWAAADNARDANAIAAFYSDDAVTLPNNSPMLEGKAAIQKDIAASLAKRAKGETVAYDIMDVYGDDNTVTEIGKTTRKDASGKVTYTGKYMAVWEKRDGKYLCVCDIANDDMKKN